MLAVAKLPPGVAVEEEVAVVMDAVVTATEANAVVVVVVGVMEEVVEKGVAVERWVSL